MSKTYYKLEVIPEGNFHATITDFELSSASTGDTTFLCLTLNVRNKGEKFDIKKYYIVNPGRNQKLYLLIRKLGIMKKGNRVSYDELIGVECEVDLYYNADGKLVVGDIEPAEDDVDDVDFSEEDDEE